MKNTQIARNLAGCTCTRVPMNSSMPRQRPHTLAVTFCTSTMKTVGCRCFAFPRLPFPFHCRGARAHGHLLLFESCMTIQQTGCSSRHMHCSSLLFEVSAPGRKRAVETPTVPPEDELFGRVARGPRSPCWLPASTFLDLRSKSVLRLRHCR